MATTIVIAGKGGTGKTTIAALLISLLSSKGIVLAVDADPSTNLDQALGLKVSETVGRVREKMTDEAGKGRLSPGVTKQDLLDYKIREALVESDRVDLIAMGRPEGPGCYCAANHMLRGSLDRLAKDYDYVVIDCEAGMEHISRQTARDIDILLIISDPTIRGLTTAARMKGLIGELRTEVGKIGLIINRARDGLSAEIEEAIGKSGLQVVTVIPEDPGIADLDMRGMPLTELPQGSPLQMAVKEIADRMGLYSR